MSSKSLITAVIVIVLLGGAYWWMGGVAPKGGEMAPVSGEPAVGGEMGAGTTAAGSIGKMTEDIYASLTAEAAYQTQKDPMSWATGDGYAKLLSKYGVTQENMDAFAAEINKDTTRAQAIAQKYMQKLTELQKAGK